MQTIRKTGRTLATMIGVAMLAAAASWSFGVLDVRAPGPATLNAPYSNYAQPAAATYQDGSGNTLGWGYPPTSTPIPSAPLCAWQTVVGQPCNTAITSSTGTTLYGTVQAATTPSDPRPRCRCSL